jgi:hypothetical protein
MHITIISAVIEKYLNENSYIISVIGDAVNLTFVAKKFKLITKKINKKYFLIVKFLKTNL